MKCRWIGPTFETQRLEVTELTPDEEKALPSWVTETVQRLGMAVHGGVGYSSDEKTARDKFEF